MLAGTVYFYDENNNVIKTMDLEDYEDLTKNEFIKIVQELKSYKVALKAYAHNHHLGKEKILYKRGENNDFIWKNK